MKPQIILHKTVGLALFLTLLSNGAIPWTLLASGVGPEPQAAIFLAHMAEVNPPVAARTRLPDPSLMIYLVQHGDTLSGIARRFGVTVATIQVVNHLSSPQLTVGQRLLIPRTAAV
jgi:hypothetical protein